jgi:hypothetical protein
VAGISTLDNSIIANLINNFLQKEVLTMARAKKEDTVEQLYDYSITVPVASAYKRKQVYDAMRGFSSCEISSPDGGTLKIKFFGLTESACDLRRAILLTNVKNRRGTPRNWEYERTPVRFRVEDSVFSVVSRNCQLSVELYSSTRVAHEGPQEGTPGAYPDRKPAEKVC